MKTIFMLVMGLFLINISCQNKSSNSGTTTATNYYWSNGSCYASNTGQVVNSTLCNSTCNTGMANNGYYWNNNYCYSSSTGQVVNSSLCSNTNYNNNGGYYWNNNACYSSSTGQVVNSTLCNSTCNTNMANNGYYWNNNYCYSSSTGQVVNSTLCSNMNNTGTMTTQCNGSYYYNQQLVTCYVSNCSGYTLIEANSGRTVYCQ